MNNKTRLGRTRCCFALTVLLVFTWESTVALSMQERSPAFHSASPATGSKPLRSSYQLSDQTRSDRLGVRSYSNRPSTTQTNSSRRDRVLQTRISSQVQQASFNDWGKPQSAMKQRSAINQRSAVKQRSTVMPASFIQEENDAASRLNIPHSKIDRVRPPANQSSQYPANHKHHHSQIENRPTVLQAGDMPSKTPSPNPKTVAPALSSPNGVTKGTRSWIQPSGTGQTRSLTDTVLTPHESTEPKVQLQATYENLFDEASATDNPRGQPLRSIHRIGHGMNGRFTAYDSQPTATEKLIRRDAENRWLQSQIDRLRAENEKLRSELKLTVDVLNRTHTALSESELQIISLTRENRSLKDGFRMLTQESARSDTEVERLLKQLRTLINQELSNQTGTMNSGLRNSSPRPINSSELRMIDPPLNEQEVVEGPLRGSEMLPSPK